MSRTDSPVLALLGCGEIARRHARTLRTVDPEVRLRFASRSRARAEAFRGELKGEQAYGSYGEALEDPEVDAVLVLTPPSEHLGTTLAALEAGRSVLVEKPAFPRSKDFGRVRTALEAAPDARVFVLENYHYRPLRRALARALEEDWVGEPLLLQVDAVKRQETRGWRSDPELAGGGALLEGGIHWIHLMASLGPRVEGVEGFAPAPVLDPERSLLVVLRYEEGMVGTLAYSWEVPSPLGGLRLSHLYGREGAVTFETNGLFLASRGRRWRLRSPGLRDAAGYRAMFADMLDALRTGRTPGMTLSMAERDLRLVEEAYRSAGLADAG